MKCLIDKLFQERMLNRSEFIFLLNNFDEDICIYLYQKARSLTRKYFSNKIFTRGLIEFTNYCRNDCYYCGIRKSNKNAKRYRLSFEDIMDCCKSGYSLGFRTFVLQGGEDLYYSDDDIAHFVSSIKKLYPDCAVTLSIGEKSYDSYLKYFQSGADRYLLRHETADDVHYSKLHPKELSSAHRKQCLLDLKNIGYQVGTGIMVGSPYQTAENIADDLIFMRELNPQMIGIGPFVPHHDTPFADKKAGTLQLTLFLLGILRLMFPNGLIPATTSLGTIDSYGREKGILSGANVVMPNLSPVGVRKKYELYDNKICMGEEAAECRMCLQGRMNKIGYELVVDKGDYFEI